MEVIGLKNSKIEENKILLMANQKISKADARKAYYNKHLADFLAMVQSLEEISVERLNVLKSWFSEFKKEEEEIIDDLKNFLPEVLEGGDAPLVKDLFKPLTADEQKQMNEWLSCIDNNMKECVSLAREQKDRISVGKHIDSKKLLDLGLFFLTNEFSFNQVFAYRERLYKSKIAEIIDNYNISRREAQDRAEITKEYFEYNIMKRHLETLKELIMYAKKYQATF